MYIIRHLFNIHIHIIFDIDAPLNKRINISIFKEHKQNSMQCAGFSGSSGKRWHATGCSVSTTCTSDG